MLPGFRRTQWAPASIAFSARVWLKWMSAITGIGESLDDRPQRLDVLLAGNRDAHEVRSRLGDGADLFHRRREVRGLGLGHRLHRDGRAAADQHAADVDLPLGGHRLILDARRSTPPRAARCLASRAARCPRSSRPPRALLRAHTAGAGRPRARRRMRNARAAGARAGPRHHRRRPAPAPAYPGPFVQADATIGLPFADGEFDLVYCSSVIEHVPRAAAERSRPRSGA